MATMNFVRTILTLGIQSIKVYGQGSMGNWVPVERVAAGREVKFEVTAYPNFTLTSWEAYYYNAYGGTLTVELSPVAGESAWTFTMPSAETFIRCEARGEVSSEYRIWTSPEVVTATKYNIDSLASRCEYMDTIMPDKAKSFSDMFQAALIQWPVIETFSPEDVAMEFFARNATRDVSLIIRHGSKGAIPHTGALNTSYDTLSNITNYNTTWRTDLTPNAYSFGTNAIQVMRIFKVDIYYEQQECTPPYGDYVMSNLLSDESGTTTSGIPVRYILSPEDSGVPTGADVYDWSVPFWFFYDIKVGYELKRITVFAVGEPPTETSLEYNLVYDGERRLYVINDVTVPDWALGIRVLIETINTIDPSEVGGTNASDTSVGGDGTYDDTSDDVPLPAIPSGISASDSGLVTLFRPSIAQVKDFGNYLWSNISDFIENLQKIFTSPMDYIIGFNIFPVTPAVGADRNIYIGNWLSTIQMPPVLNQFYEFNAGVIQVKEYFGSFLDYYPNTRARIMLPFIGDREININEIMGKTLHLWYRIDLLSGACVAILNINDNVYYQWNGNCAVAVPVTGSDWSRLYSGIARAGLIVGSTLAFGAAGGITASMTTETLSGAEQAAAVSAVSDSFANLPKGVPGVAAMRRSLSESLENISEPRKTTVETHSSRAIKASTMVRAVGYNVMGGSSRAQHTGDMTGAITIMGNRTPYLVLEYPNVNLPENYKHIFGYPNNQYAVLGNLSGYTKCKEVLFESTTATDDEIEMIISALKGGVYL